MKRVIALALVLVVFMFATTIATTMIGATKMKIPYKASSIENIGPLGGDPIDDPGPPGAGTG